MPLPSDKFGKIEKEVEKAMLEETKLKSIATIPALHCPNSYCVSMVTENDYKIVFSGDTRPIEGLVELGKKDQKTNLLIHEATFDDNMQKEALEKRHSTTTEAIDVGKRMKAYRTVLTHFSQRYPKIPVLPEEQEDHVGIAFDFMRIPFPALNWIPTMLPALQAVFRGDQEAEASNDAPTAAPAAALPP